MENNLVSFIPANIVITGKSMTEKRMSVATVAGTVSSMYIATKKGKAANMARENLGRDSVTAMVKACAEGNYRPLAESLAFIMGENLSFTKLADVDSFIWATEHAIDNLKDGGYNVKTGKVTSKMATLTEAQNLATNVMADCRDLIAGRVALRALAKAAATPTAEIKTTEPAPF